MRFGQGPPPAGGWKKHMANDPDYSPAYQDEYQRLWHEAAALATEAEDERVEWQNRCVAAEARVAELTEVLEFAIGYAQGCAQSAERPTRSHVLALAAHIRARVDIPAHERRENIHVSGCLLPPEHDGKCRT